MKPKGIILVEVIVILWLVFFSIQEVFFLYKFYRYSREKVQVHYRIMFESKRRLLSFAVEEDMPSGNLSIAEVKEGVQKITDKKTGCWIYKYAD